MAREDSGELPQKSKLKPRRSISNLFERRRTSSNKAESQPIPISISNTRQLAPVDPILRKSLALMDDELNQLGIGTLPPSPRSPRNETRTIDSTSTQVGDSRSLGMDRNTSQKENAYYDQNQSKRLSLGQFQLASRISFGDFGDFTDSLGEELALHDYTAPEIVYDTSAFRSLLVPILPPVSLKSANSIASTMSTAASTSDSHLDYAGLDYKTAPSTTTTHSNAPRHISKLSSNLSDFPAPPKTLNPPSLPRQARSSSLVSASSIGINPRPAPRSIPPPTTVHNEDYSKDEREEEANSKLAEIVLANSGRGGMATEGGDTGLGLTTSTSDNSISSTASSMSSGPFIAYRAPAPTSNSRPAERSLPSSRATSVSNSPNPNSSTPIAPPITSTPIAHRNPTYLTANSGPYQETLLKSNIIFPTNSRESHSPNSLPGKSAASSMMTRGSNSSPQPRAAHLGSPVFISNSTFPNYNSSSGIPRSSSSNISGSPRSNNDLYNASLAGLGLTGEYDMPLWQGSCTVTEPPSTTATSTPRRPGPPSSPLAMASIPIVPTARRGSFSILRRRKSEAILVPPMKETRSVSEPIPSLPTRVRRQSESESDVNGKRKSRLSMFLPKRKDKVIPPMPIIPPLPSTTLVRPAAGRKVLSVSIPPPGAFINTTIPSLLPVASAREEEENKTRTRGGRLPSPPVLPSPPISVVSSNYFPTDTKSKSSARELERNQLAQTPASSVFHEDREMENLDLEGEEESLNLDSASRNSSPSPFIARSPIISPPETIESFEDDQESLAEGSIRSNQVQETNSKDSKRDMQERARLALELKIHEKRTLELDFGQVSEEAFSAMEERRLPALQPSNERSATLVTPRRLEIRRPIAVSGIDLSKDSPSDFSEGISLDSGEFSRLPKSPSDENNFRNERIGFTEERILGNEKVGMAMDGAEDDNRPLGAIPGALSMQKSLRGSIREKNGRKKVDSSARRDPFEFDGSNGSSGSKDGIEKRNRQDSEISTISSSSRSNHFGHSMLPQTDESVVRRQGLAKSPSLPLDTFISDSVLTMDLPATAPIISTVVIQPLRIRTRTVPSPPNVEPSQDSRKSPDSHSNQPLSANALARLQAEQNSHRPPIASTSHSNPKTISPPPPTGTSRTLTRQPSMENGMGSRSRSNSKSRMDQPSRVPTLSRKPSLTASQTHSTERAVPVPVPTTQHRIFINDHTKHIIISATNLTRCGDVVADARARKALNTNTNNGGTDSDGGYALWEIWRSLGVERPIREFELLGDVIKTWSHDSSNILIIRRTSLWPVLSSHLRPQPQQPRAGWVNIEIKRGKWSKRWLELRDGSLTHFKSEKLKDSVFLCNLASFDIFFVAPHTITQIKAPKPFAFAIKSALPSAHYENREEYCHFVSVKVEEDRDGWIKSVIEARNNFVRQRERDMMAAANPTPTSTGPLYSTNGTGTHSTPAAAIQPLSASNLQSNAAARSKSISSRAPQPLLNLAAPAMVPGLSLDSRLGNNPRLTPGVSASRPDAREWATFGAEQRTEWLKNAEATARKEKSAFITF